MVFAVDAPFHDGFLSAEKTRLDVYKKKFFPICSRGGGIYDVTTTGHVNVELKKNELDTWLDRRTS